MAIFVETIKDYSEIPVTSNILQGNPFLYTYNSIAHMDARALIGGCIFIYSGSARLVSFEMKLMSKEVSRAEPEYMNIHPPPPQLAF